MFLFGVFPLTVFIIALISSAVHWRLALIFSAIFVHNWHLILVQFHVKIRTMEEVRVFMAIRYKVDIMAKLKEKGYSSTKIREEKLIGQSYLQQLRHGELVSWKTLDTICALLDCQPGDLLEYVKEAPEDR